MSWLSRMLQRAVPSSQAIVLHGIAVEVENTRDDIRTGDVLARLDDALALVAAYAPGRFRHLQRDVRAIRVIRFPTRGAFLPEERTVLTELTFLARRDISAAPVASSILHEGVHARVHAFRARVMRGRTDYQYGTDAMTREERLCRRAELAFGLALPPELGAPVLERARASLALEDQDVAPVVDWGLAEQRQREIDGRA
jgi:hypothetical protein